MAGTGSWFVYSMIGSGNSGLFPDIMYATNDSRAMLPAMSVAVQFTV